MPKSMILIGQEGCGKTTLIKNLSERLNVDLEEVPDNVDENLLLEYIMNPIQRIYVIDLVKFKEKNQNIFLKFIEEPSFYSNIILTARSEIGVLETILNRCIKYHFDEYTKEELSSISWMNAAWDNELLYKVCKTPGQILEFDGYQIEKLYNLCNDVVNKLNSANYSNTLSIYTKINMKEDYNKFDFNTFFNMLELCAFEKYIKTFDELSLKIYSITNKYKSKYIESNNPVKEQFVINFLTNLWKEVHR